MLLFLLLVPWSVWVGARIRSLTPGRRWTAIVLRVLILACLVAALAGAELVKKNDKLAVFFLLDRSNSIPESLRDAAADAVRTTCKDFMKSRDEAGVVIAGDEASIELDVRPAMELGEVKSFVGGEQTDLAASIRLAMAAFPQGCQKRIVLYSDGNETRGSAVEEAKLAQAAGIEVDVMPLHIGGDQEVRILDVSVPNRVNADEPFQLKVVVRADQDCEGTLRVYERVGGGQRLLKPQNVTLQKGDNAFLLNQQLDAPGFYEYEASIESTADTVMANNEGRAFTVIQGEPTVLYVDSDPAHSTFLEPALRSKGVKVVRADLGNIPGTLAQFQNYDAVILSDVSATDLSSEQMRAIESMVRDLGIGLVMIGGPRSYGAGGFLDTPVEKALPVSMDLKQRKVLPRGALVLIMHTCEIPDGNAWARDIGLASLNVLASQDLMGTLGYMYPNGDSWIYQLQPVGDKAMMRQAINAASTQIGDMPSVAPTLQLAANALVPADAAAKRIIMISDGDPGAPTAALLDQLAAAKIAVSTVCIAPHSINDQQMLQWVAQKTGGQYYYVTNPNNLPQIFAKEASVVKRGLLIEKPFIPKPFHESEVLTGLLEKPLPVLKGYVATTAKDNATVALVSNESDPVLAHWRYGIGKSVAFTSDVTSRWAADWAAWPDFAAFWTQTVRWAMRAGTPSDLRVSTSVEGNMGHLKIDAVDAQGKFVNFLRPKAAVTGPGPKFARQDLDIVQTGPGIYEGKFPLDERGIYMAAVTYSREDGSSGMIPAGIALNYSREYEYNATNVALLERIAETGGGKVLDDKANPFVHDLQATATITPVWQALAIVAACLLPLDVFVRRVVIDYGRILAAILALFAKFPGLGRLVPRPRLAGGPVTGFYGAAVAERGRVRAAASTPDAASFALHVAEPVADIDETKPAAKKGRPPKGPKRPLAPPSEYTQQLFAAKKEAAGRMKRRSGSPTDKEK
jgi:uncharacterized membrane protein/Mg-chelatase subunit ChlD